MKRDLSEEQVSAIKKALENAIEKGPWGESNFLKVIGKNLEDIRDVFLMDVGHLQSSANKESHLARRVALRNNQREIYISLYTSEGSLLASWERILVNLPKHVTSRPIYAKEEDVQSLIRSRDNPVNEAYVAVHIEQSSILELPPEKMSKDRHGIPILALKDKTIHMDNIARFVHRSGVYRFIKGRLMKQSSNSDDALS